MITLKRYRRVETLLREVGYGPMIDWSTNIQKPVDADAFAREAAFVICGSGFRNSIAAPILERCMIALKDGRSAATEFGHKGKHQAIDFIWAQRERLFSEYLGAEDKLAFLRQLPWIGPITCFHLEKNLGGNHAKPDVHMERLARRDRTTTHKLCEQLARKTGLPVATMDSVLWIACSRGLIDSACYEAEGWNAAFQPKNFLAREAGATPSVSRLVDQ